MSPPLLSRRKVLQGGGALVVSFAIHGCTGRDSATPDLSPAAHTEAIDERHIGAWLRIDDDGSVVIFTGKAELGQGLRIPLAQIAADELDVSIERISIVTADTARCPNEGYTFGSLSIQNSGSAIRRASAEARLVLCELAARKWNVDPGSVTTRRGMLVSGSSEMRYEDALVGDLYHRTVSENTPLQPPKPDAYVGRNLNRPEVHDIVFGNAYFIQDLRLDNMLHGRIVRPPSIDAVLENTDMAAAQELEGVVNVHRDGSFLGVVAEREDVAQKAADLLCAATTWHDEDPVNMPANVSKLVESFPHDESVLVVRQSAIPDDDRKFNARFERPFQAHASLAPSIAIALLDNDQLTVWSHTQGVFPLRKALSIIFEMDETNIRVIHEESAGCYGHNGADDAALDAALLAQATPGRPVKLQWTRSDEFQREPYGSAMTVDVAATLNDAGQISSWSSIISGFGHSNRPGTGAGNLISARKKAKSIEMPPALNIPSPVGGLDRNGIPLYQLAGLEVVERFIPARPVSTSSLRTLGAYANVFAIESTMDALASQAGKHPIDFRLEHMADPRARKVLAALRKIDRDFAIEPSDEYSVGRGYGFACYKNRGAYYAALLDVHVDTASSNVQVRRIRGVVDCGVAINPDGVRNQIEGGAIQSLSWTLFEEATFSEGRSSAMDWSTYPILRFSHAPEIETQIIENPEISPVGVGEASQGPIAAALANAVAAATNRRPLTIPILQDGRLR